MLNLHVMNLYLYLYHEFKFGTSINNVMNIEKKSIGANIEPCRTPLHIDLNEE